MIAILNNNRILVALLFIFIPCIVFSQNEYEIKVGYNDFFKKNKIKSFETIFYSVDTSCNPIDSIFSDKYFFSPEGFLQKKQNFNNDNFYELSFYYDEFGLLIHSDTNGFYGYSSVNIFSDDTTYSQTEEKNIFVGEKEFLIYEKILTYHQLDTILNERYFFYNKNLSLDYSIGITIKNNIKTFYLKSKYYYYKTGLIYKIDFFSEEKECIGFTIYNYDFW